MRSQGITEQVVSPQVAGLAEVFGRDEELAALEKAFAAKSKSTIRRVLTGMGGVGKTSLARAYAQNHLDDYGVVWWIRAEDPAAVDAEFRGLLEVVLKSGEASRIRDAVTAACAWLGKSPDRWLLVLDNVPDPSAVRGLIPAKGNGHVLITTQATQWPNPDTVLPVNPLDTQRSVELLTALSQDHDEAAAEDLANELDGLPLALTQAASFVRANAVDLATYTRFYREHGEELLGDNRPDDYSHTVATTWRVAIDRLPASARNLLNVIAYFAPDSIPTSVFAPRAIPLLPDEFSVSRAIGELARHSLVSPGAKGTISVHRLVQSVTRHDLAGTSDWRGLATGLITAALPPRPVTVETTAKWNRLHTHAYALLDHVPDDDPITFDLRYELAFWIGEAGNAKAAKGRLADLVAAQARVLGPVDIGTLKSTHGVAYWTRTMGQASEARDIYAELLPLQIRTLGADHPDTQITRHDLAAIALDDDASTAYELFTELVEVRRRVLGPEHRYTLASMSQLAQCVFKSGREVEAIRLCTDLVAMKSRVLGPEHRDTLYERVTLTTNIYLMGDVQTAWKMKTELFPIVVRVLGEEHPTVLTLYLELVFLTMLSGNSLKARHMLLGVQVMVRAGLDPQQPIVKEIQRISAQLNNGGGKKRR